MNLLSLAPPLIGLGHFESYCFYWAFYHFQRSPAGFPMAPALLLIATACC
jgi:hypothetical protein